MGHKGYITEGDNKIDNQATDGLLGVHNSLAYRVHEIEKHLHSREVWFGVHSVVDPGVNEGEAWSVTPFTSTSGADSVLGAWIPILGTSDTPFKATYASFDVHRLEIPDVVAGASLKPHLIQVTWGDSGAAGFAAGDYTGFWTIPEKGGRASPVVLQCPRITAGTKVFLRHAVVGQAAATMDCYIGMHEYAG
jgi:hypothetical protein